MSDNHQDLNWATDADHAGHCNHEVLENNSFTVAGIFSKVVHVKGHCPYCFGEVNIQMPLRLIGANARSPIGQSNSSKSLDVTVTCTCELPHAGRPAGKAGCGRSWIATGVK